MNYLVLFIIYILIGIIYMEIDFKLIREVNRIKHKGLFIFSLALIFRLIAASLFGLLWPIVAVVEFVIWINDEINH